MYRKESKSWYDLSYGDAKKLENEFVSHDLGRDANMAMHLCVMIGIITFVVSALFLMFMFLNENFNPYLFVIMVLFVFLGMIIIVGSTIEYHVKFNSWLLVSKNIVKK